MILLIDGRVRFMIGSKFDVYIAPYGQGPWTS